MVEQGIIFDKSWFVQSKQGNIKDEYYFEKKLGSGGYGAVYLAQHKVTSKYSSAIDGQRYNQQSYGNVETFCGTCLLMFVDFLGYCFVELKSLMQITDQTYLL